MFRGFLGNGAEASFPTSCRTLSRLVAEPANELGRRRDSLRCVGVQKPAGWRAFDLLASFGPCRSRLFLRRGWLGGFLFLRCRRFFRGGLFLRLLFGCRFG